MSNSSYPYLRYHAVLESIAPALFPDRPNPEDALQEIAGELTLWEMVFVFPADQPRYAARLRIFTLARGHIPSATHATMRLNAGAICQR